MTDWFVPSGWEQPPAGAGGRLEVVSKVLCWVPKLKLLLQIATFYRSEVLQSGKVLALLYSLQKVVIGANNVAQNDPDWMM